MPDPVRIVSQSSRRLTPEEIEERRRAEADAEAARQALADLETPAPAPVPAESEVVALPAPLLRPSRPVPTPAHEERAAEINRRAPGHGLRITAQDLADNDARTEERVAEARGLLADPQGFVGPSGRAPQRPPVQAPVRAEDLPMPARPAPQPAPSAPPVTQPQPVPPTGMRTEAPSSVAAQPSGAPPARALGAPGAARSPEPEFVDPSEEPDSLHDKVPSRPEGLSPEAQRIADEQQRRMDVVAQLYERSRNAAQRRTILNIFGILLNGFFRFVSAAGGGGRDGVRRFTPVGSSSGERAAEQELSERAELWRMADAVREQNAQREEARKEEAAEREERTAQRTAEGQLRERQLALQERGVAAQEAHSLSARQEAEEMLRRRTAMRDASSVESQSVRDGFMREIEIMQGLGWRAPRAIMQALPTMSGEQIESIREGGAMQSAYRRYGIRGRGGVGGGASGGGRGASPAPGAVAREQWGTANDPLVGAATSAGVPDVVARSMAGDAGERARLTRSLATGSLTQGRQEAGRLDADTRNLGRDLDDQRRITNAAERANQLFRGASDAELRAAFMGGALGDLAPERIQQLRSAANELQAETLRERSGATVSDPEFERTRRELGTMPTTSPSVSRGWVTRAVRHYRDMRGRIRARYGDDVVSAYDQRLRREGVDAGSARGNAGAPAQPTRARRVNVRNAQGEVRSVPESQLDRARAAGWEPVTRGR